MNPIGILLLNCSFFIILVYFSPSPLLPPCKRLERSVSIPERCRSKHTQAIEIRLLRVWNLQGKHQKCQRIGHLCDLSDLCDLKYLFQTYSRALFTFILNLCMLFYGPNSFLILNFVID